MANLLGWTVTVGITMLVLAGVVIGVGAFRDTQTSGDISYEVLNDTITMFENAGDQLSTVGTMIGVGLLIGVILIAFAGYGYGKSRGFF